MAYAFKKNQQVKFKFRLDFSPTFLGSGPIIRKGTKATVIKRSKCGSYVWLQMKTGIRRMAPSLLVAA